MITDAKSVVLKQSELIQVNQRFEIDVSTLKPGMYFLRIQTKDGSKTLSFVKL